jgi:3',5'-cyclic AMP phosphodiesterase CpdA
MVQEKVQASDSMFRLAHISDLHYYDSIKVPIKRLLSKRITGYTNFFLHRRFQYSSRVLGLLLENIRKQNVDHLVVTGDLTNLSLGAEFAGAREMLLDNGFSPSSVSVIPGNHDRYTRGSERARRFEGYLSPFMKSDVDLWPHAFPFVRLRGDVVIVGINSALSLPLLMAGGEVGIEQLTRLEVLFQHPDVRDRFPVFLIHHPPYRHPRKEVHRFEGLRDYRALLRAIPSRSALFLHGHLHRNIHRKLDSNGRRFLFSGVSASSNRFKGLSSSAVSSFILYDMDRHGVHSVRCFKYRAEADTYVPDDIAMDVFQPLTM